MNLLVEFLIWNRGFSGGQGNTGAMGGSLSSGCVDNGTNESKICPEELIRISS